MLCTCLYSVYVAAGCPATCPFCRFYLYNTALQASDSITELGAFNWQMFLALAGAWLLVYICLFRGVETSGKVRLCVCARVCMCICVCTFIVAPGIV